MTESQFRLGVHYPQKVENNMSEQKVTKSQIALMHHTIGVHNTVGVSELSSPYRNYYSASNGCDCMDELNELVEMGLMVKRESAFSSDTLFHLTSNGYMMIGFHSTYPGHPLFKGREE